MIKRRQFLKYSSLSGVSLAIVACQPQRNNSNSNSQSNSEIKEAVNFGKLEKTQLNIGFVPILEAAPLIIAQEKGFFQRYGLTVKLYKQPNWQEIEKGLVEARFDLAQTTLAMPLVSQLAKMDMVGLMMLNRNGQAIAFNANAWQQQLRTSLDYFNFQEFAAPYRQYFRNLDTKPKFAIDHNFSFASYSLRYWLAAMGINPEQEVILDELPPSQQNFKLQSGTIQGYCGSVPANQEVIETKKGYITYISRDIWRGHPGTIISTFGGWLKKYPNTARAFIAAILEACQYCSNLVNANVIATNLSTNSYLNTKVPLIESCLNGNYNYSNLDKTPKIANISDFLLFDHEKVPYITEPDHVNYIWHSYGIWILTQMIRWNQIKMREYPADADKIMSKTYPHDIYSEVAKALNIKIPTEKLKKEPSEAFIDNRDFDPSNPVGYLNQFKIRA